MSDRTFDFERDFQRYLAAKRTVDDRTLDRRAFDRLRNELDAADAIRVLEVGAGIGAMVARLIALDALPDRAEYLAIDRRQANVDAARQRLPKRAEREGYDVTATDGGLRFDRGARTVSLDLVVGDAVEVVRNEDDEWDLLIGQAVLDVLDDEALPSLLAAVPGGLCYFPGTFDGGTHFAPGLDLDARVERRYHRHMDRTGGDSRAGRRALARLRALGADVLAAGGSDWVVRPTEGTDGYPADEAYFLHFIVDTIADALADDPELADDAFREWIETRHRQIEAGKLIYVAHQLDVLARAPRE